MTGISVGNVGAGGGYPIGDLSLLGGLAADLNGPNGQQAMTLLAQEINDALQQDPRRATEALQQLQAIQQQQLMLLLALLDPEVLEALRGAISAAQGAKSAGGGGVRRGGGGGGGGGGFPMGRGMPTGGGNVGGGTGGRGSPTPSLNTGNRNLSTIDPAARGRTVGDTNVPAARTYPPGSDEARALFREAARLAGVPESWADSPGLHNILRRESGGQVGRPNYTYGDRARDPSQWGSIHEELRNGVKTTRSSATGLGQLLLSNVDRYYPNGRAGIGDPLQEAAGMLRYIQDRYGNPDNAWRLYGTRHEGY